MEQGDAEQSEKSLLLTGRRTSSFDQDIAAGMSRAFSGSLSQKGRQPQRSLDMAAAPEASTSGGVSEHTPQSNKMKGLAFAATSTVFQAVMSVFAKVLGKTLLLIATNTQCA